MTRACVLCKHPERADFEAGIINGSLTMREVAQRIHRSDASVSRHMKQHVTEAVKAVQQQRLRDSNDSDFGQKMQELWSHDALTGIRVLDEIEQLKTRTHSIIDEAEEKGDLRAALKGIEVLQKQLEFRARTEQVLITARNNLIESHDVVTVLREEIGLSPEQMKRFAAALFERSDGSRS